MAIEGTHDPVQFRDAKGGSNAGTGGIFDQAAGEMRLAEASVNGQQRGHAKFIVNIGGAERAGNICGCERHREFRVIEVYQSENLLIALCKSIETSTRIVAACHPGQRGLAAPGSPWGAVLGARL